LDLALGLDDGVAAHSRCHRHRSLAAPPEQLGHCPRDHPALDLVHVRQDHVEESRETLVGELHVVMMLRAA